MVSDIGPTTFMRVLHPHRGEDSVHHRVPHVEATALLPLLALPLVPGARRGNPRRPGALPCTAQINRTTHQSRNLHLARSAERTRCIRTSYTRGFKGRRHKGQWSKVRSIETIESSIVGSCSVYINSPSSCTTISCFIRAGALQSFTVTYS